jgi:hypothetical protein
MLAGLVVLTITAFVAAPQASLPSDSVGTVSGAVYDSVARAPIGNATVQLIRGSLVLNATTDGSGRFGYRDVPPGRYVAGFLHPLLDSIGVESPAREVIVEAGRETMVSLAIPSVARIRTAVCGEAKAQPGGGLVIGTVRDALTAASVSDVTVLGEWVEYVITRAGVARRIGRASTTTGASGWYALCGVPGNGSVAVTAVSGSDTTGTIELQLSAEGFIRHELFIGELRTAVRDDTSRLAQERKTTGARRSIRVGSGRLIGRIVSAQGDVPIANAQVSLTAGPATQANELGEFVLTNAPLGSQMLEVRALGYYPDRRPISVVADAPSVIIKLSTLKAVLDTVKILATPLATGPDDGGFARRRRMGNGRFITPADMDRFPVINTTDVFQRVPRMRTDKPKILMRGAFPSAQGQLSGDTWCEVSIFINGHNVSFMSQEDINDAVYPHEVKGIEIYSEGTVPPQFQVGLRGCGSVVIWTR